MLTVDAIALFLDDRRARNCRPRTIEFYGRELARIEQIARQLPTAPGLLKAVLGSVHGAEASVYATYRALKVFYRFLLREEEIAVNPMDRIGAPKVHRKRPRTLDADDAAALLQLNLSARNLAMLTLLLDSGIRSGELRGLRGRDLRKGEILVDGKTGERVVPVHPSTMALLRAQVSTDDDFLFRTSDGRPLTRGRVYLIVRDALEKAGLERASKNGAHLLRHTFGTAWVAQDGPLPALKVIMGHTSIMTTMLYVEVADQEVKRSHAKFSQLTQPHEEKMRLVK